MMELKRHIEILLLSNDCVIVPNLGGFMAHHLDARYDQADGMLIPPQRTLGFNPQLSMSDSLLAQSYVDAYDISFPEAVKRIESEVHLLKKRIETEGRITLPDLGSLYVTPEGNYAFDPCPSGILTPSLYGFGAIEMPLLSKKQQQTAALRTIELPTQPFGILEPATTRRPSKLATIMSHIDQTETPQEEKTISIKVSLLRNLAVTAVAAVALLLFARPVPQGESAAIEATSEEASVVAMPEIAKAESAPQLESILGSLEKVSQKIQISNEEGVVPEAGSYTIVLAYSLPLENAKQFLSEIKAKGARKAVLTTYKSENVIVYGSYSSNSEAYSHLQELQADGCVSSGWIMQMK